MLMDETFSILLVTEISVVGERNNVIERDLKFMKIQSEVGSAAKLLKLFPLR